MYYLGLAIVFIDEYNPSKIFKIASNSFEVTDVPLRFDFERKQSRRFRHNSIICQKATKGFALVGTVPRSKVMQS